jgi:uncharacterized OsmC-like protein
MVKVRPLEQKRLLATAGRHQFVTDRKPEEGGNDAGCTSGELLLVSIGSCATGSVRNFMRESGLPFDRLAVNVDYEPPAKPGERDTIAIVIELPAEILAQKSDAIIEAARGGGVVSRMLLGSHLALRCQPV